MGIMGSIFSRMSCLVRFASSKKAPPTLTIGRRVNIGTWRDAYAKFHSHSLFSQKLDTKISSPTHCCIFFKIRSSPSAFSLSSMEVWKFSTVLGLGIHLMHSKSDLSKASPMEENFGWGEISFRFLTARYSIVLQITSLTSTISSHALLCPTVRHLKSSRIARMTINRACPGSWGKSLLLVACHSVILASIWDFYEVYLSFGFISTHLSASAAFSTNSERINVMHCLLWSDDDRPIYVLSSCMYPPWVWFTLFHSSVLQIII